MTTNEEQETRPPRPWYGIDKETGEQYFGPLSEQAALSARDAHPRREWIELGRHPKA